MLLPFHYIGYQLYLFLKLLNFPTSASLTHTHCGGTIYAPSWVP